MSNTDLLWLMQLASPALPVGGFSYSESLEAAVEHGLVNDEASAQAWLLDQLHLVQARSELPVVAQAIGTPLNRQLFDQLQVMEREGKLLLNAQAAG